MYQDEQAPLKHDVSGASYEKSTVKKIGENIVKLTISATVSYTFTFAIDKGAVDFEKMLVYSTLLWGASSLDRLSRK